MSSFTCMLPFDELRWQSAEFAVAYPDLRLESLMMNRAPSGPHKARHNISRTRRLPEGRPWCPRKGRKTPCLLQGCRRKGRTTRTGTACVPPRRPRSKH